MMSQHNGNFTELIINQIDQQLGFAHLLARMESVGRGHLLPRAGAFLTFEQMKEILQLKMQLSALFDGGSSPVFSTIINTQVAKLLLNALMIALNDSLKASVFDQERFLRATGAVKAIADKISFQDDDQWLAGILQDDINQVILQIPLKELLKPDTRRSILLNLQQKTKQRQPARQRASGHPEAIF